MVFRMLVSSTPNPKSLTNINKKINPQLVPKRNEFYIKKTNARSRKTPRDAKMCAPAVGKKEYKQICEVNVKRQKQATEWFKSNSLRSVRKSKKIIDCKYVTNAKDYI